MNDHPILVTGAAGQAGGVGAAVVQRLLQRNVYELTGPRSQTLYGLAEEFSRALPRG